MNSAASHRVSALVSHLVSSSSSSEIISSILPNGLGILTLNKPSTLNSLSLSMLESLLFHLRLFSYNPFVVCVILLSSSPKAFCAGGDIRHLVSDEVSFYPESMFRIEYSLNYFISTYPKPFLSLLNGITMGGGAGLAVHGKYRIAGPNCLFAMPETGIGLFPDVGATYFLPRLTNPADRTCNGEFGLYLGLTGRRLKGVESVYAGITTHYCSQIDKFIEAIKNSNSLSSSLESLLNDFCPSVTVSPAFVAESRLISKAFTGSSINEILDNLKQLKANSQENEAARQWASKELNQLLRMSPTSVCLTYHSIRSGRSLSLVDCLAMEYRLAVRCCRLRELSDFPEGVRALIIDKDNKPTWKPWPNQSQIQQFFQPFHEDKGVKIEEWKPGQF
jgi:enoyl-CoA hydratase/carnithine racemase